MKTITEYDRGYWIAVQNVASFDFQPDKQAVKVMGGMLKERLRLH